MIVPSGMSDNNQDSQLKRTLGFPALVLYGLGTIIGAGIYVLIGEVAGAAGTASPISFALAAVLAGFSAFTMAELVSRYPKSAGEAIYVREGLTRRVLPIIVGLLVVAVGTVSAAAIANGFVGYLNILIDVPAPIAITFLVLTLGAIACWGIAQSTALIALITLVEVGGLLLIIGVGTAHIDGPLEQLQNLWPPSQIGTSWAIFNGAFLAFYAFIGFEDMVNVAEEVKDVRRVMPRAIVWVLFLSTLLYVAIATVSVLVVPASELAQSAAPLTLVYQRATGRSPEFITIISMFAVINGALIQIIMASRILYGLRDEWRVLSFFGEINRVTQTPIRATLSVTTLLLILALAFPLVTLAQVTSAITLVIFTLLNLALIRIKRRDPNPHGVYCVPFWVPVVGFVISLSFVFARIFLPL